MRALAGQAGRGVRWLLRGSMALALLLGLGAGALGWRLSRGPIELPALASAMASAAADRGVPVEIGRVFLAWQGWGDETLPHPLVLRVEQAVLRDERGRVRAHLPEAEARLAPGRLLRGEVLPGFVSLRGAHLELDLAADGTVSLGLPGDPAAAVPPESAGPGPAPGGPPIRDPAADPLARLLRPDGPLAALREVRVADTTLLLRGPGLPPLTLSVPLLTLRRPDAALLAEGELRLGGEGIAGNAVPALRLSGQAGASGEATLRLELTLPNPPALVPALGTLHPALASLNQVQAPARLLLDLSRAPSPSPAPGGASGSVAGAAPGGATEAASLPSPLAGARLAGRAELSLGAGRIAPPGVAPVPVQSVSVRLSGEAGADGSAALRLDAARVALPPPRPDGTGPVLPARGTAALREGWEGRLELALDRVAMPDLGRYWPEGVAPGAREWVLPNVTAGTAHDGQWRFAARAARDLSAPRLTEAAGALRFEGGTVHWLRPVPPVEGVSGVMRLVNPTEILIEARGGRQSGTALTVPEATARITALGAQEQMEIELRAAGPLVDVMAVLRHPRLHLFDRRPLDLREQGGTIDATASLAFPLIADLPAERIRIQARGRGRDLRLADVVAGQSIERGQVELSVDTEGMRLSGTADLGPVRNARLGVELDFRDGPAQQVVTRYRGEARTEAANLAAFGLELGEIVTGPVAVNVLAEGRRNGAMQVALRGDLRDAAMSFSPLGWAKPPGQPGSAEANLRVRGPVLESVEGLRVEAAGLSLRGRAGFAEQARLRRLEFTESRIGETAIAEAGVEPPARPGEPWRIAVRSPVVDLRALLDGGPAPAGPPGAASAERPVPLQIEGTADRGILAAGEVRGLRAAARTDTRGTLWTLRAAGTVADAQGQNGAMEAEIAPNRAGQRELSLRSANAGALLRATGVARHLVGGQLRVRAHWRGDAPGAPLLGEAEMDEFSVLDMPAVAKFLQAITVFGVFDAVRGPGLHFARLHAPFALTPEALGLEDAQAFSASLGLTARGRIARRSETVELDGTIVPAYALNSLLGRIPVLGRLFSPEVGGGLFAATYRVSGRLDDPSVSVNPLAALTPGFLRGLFGGGGSAPPQAPAAPQAAAPAPSPAPSAAPAERRR